MKSAATNWSDQHIAAIIGDLLRAGVVLAAALTLVGGAIYLKHAESTSSNYEVFHGEPAALRTVKGVLSDAVSGQGRGIIQLGLLFLIATPVARVVFSVFAFAIQRDWFYVVISLAVLAILLFSLTGGHI
jgi:uncharacterized membrane protein